MSPLFSIAIPKRATNCVKGKERFVHGMEYFSILVEESETENYRREDFCSVCWSQGVIQKAKSFWKGKVPEGKEAEESHQQNNEGLLGYLKMLMEESRFSHAFVLALYLTRKKQLIFRKEVVHQGQKVHLYEVPITEEMLSIPRAELSFHEVQQIQATLEEKFLKR